MLFFGRTEAYSVSPLMSLKLRGSGSSDHGRTDKQDRSQTLHLAFNNEFDVIEKELSNELQKSLENLSCESLKSIKTFS